ncbi:hypothetical protein RUND412_008990 [Rhizina undulata]
MCTRRYYGKSTPYPISTDTPAKDFQWLTTEQALADIPAFADSFRRKNFPNEDLTPRGTPWIFMGGSYPGMRGAFLRLKYPSTIFATYAASAPVQARLDMSVYFEPIYRGMLAYGYANCTANIHDALDYIDQQLEESPETSAEMKKMFLGRGGELNSNAAFAENLVHIFYLWQGKGMDGGTNDGLLRNFCNWLSTETDTATGRVAPEKGWALEKGKKWIAERWAKWPSLIEVTNHFSSTTCEGSKAAEHSIGFPPACELDKPSNHPSGIAWTWQYCSEWGYFQAADRGRQRLISKFNDLEHQQKTCYRQFPDGLRSGYLPLTPQVDKMNAMFGGWHMRPSNTLFTAGEFDPWRTLSVFSEESFAPRGVKVTHEIPECNAPTAQNEVFGYLLRESHHCYDLKADNPSGVGEEEKARTLFSKALKKWLPCFKKQKQG